MSQTADNRNLVIDVLRVIGTLFVILAHVNIPSVLSMIRSFDVCLLVLVSGYIYSERYKSNLHYGKYVIKRFKRLCIPAYITASVIFATCFLLCLLVEREYPYTGIQIVETYLFIGGRSGGIGYFWIIRIYLLMALIAPAMKILDRKIRSNILAIAVPFASLLISQLIYIFTWERFGTTYDMILENLVMSTLAYGAVYFTGIRLQSNRKFKPVAFVAYGLSATAFIVYFILSGSAYIVSDYKYPPQAEYVTISVFVAIVVWEMIKLMLQKAKHLEIISWLSKHSFNMYLVHIFVLFAMSWGNKIISKIPLLDLWFVRYAVILLCCIVAVKVFEVITVAQKRKKQV